MYRVSPHVRHFASALMGGAGAATLWVNLAPDSYYDVLEYRFWAPSLPDWTGLPDPVLTLQYITSEGLMALLIAFIAKELWEALVLERGALAGPTRRTVPLGAVFGGVIGAVLIWLLALPADPDVAALGRIAGWPLPIGSDVVLTYVFGAWVFGKAHPALHLLLLISIAFDILGLIGLGLAFPTGGLHPVWLVLSVLALILVWRFAARLARPDATELQRRRAAALWPYLLAGVVCWIGVILSGLPGALGLLPLIPLVPHAGRSFGLFAEAEEFLHDPLNRLAQLLVRPLPVVLFLFGLTRGGVDLSAMGPMTGRVLEAMWLGKPLGLMIGALLAVTLRRGSLPSGLRLQDLLLIAVLSGMGFTVPLLALGSALPGGFLAEQARAGVALSLWFGPLALVASRALKRSRRRLDSQDLS
ncbi:MAG: Na+/H+ antiporter NhaA [Cypionkella sp.]